MGVRRVRLERLRRCAEELCAVVDREHRRRDRIDARGLNGVVYVGSNDNNLYAFNASGQTGCSGVPKTCQPLWTACTMGPVKSSPAVANGVVYVGSEDDNLYALNTSGQTGCSGVPKRCQPLWTATHRSPGGAVACDRQRCRLHRVRQGLRGPRRGSIDCSGTPKTCTALLAAPLPDQNPVVTHDRERPGRRLAADDHLHAFALP